MKNSVSRSSANRSDRSKPAPPCFCPEPSEPEQIERSPVCDEEQLSSSTCCFGDGRQNSSWVQSSPPEQSCSETRSGKNVLQEELEELRVHLRRRLRVTEGSDEAGSENLFSRAFTELWITEELREDVQTELETNKLRDAPLRSNSIFRSCPDQHGSIRVVLTNGVAGAGKSFLVQKFTLDWAEGLENQDISAVVPLSFRELNLVREEQHSLLTLIQTFHPSFQKIPAEQLSICKLLFIFDGLDESRLSLDFNSRQVVSDVTQKSPVNVLLTNLIQGRLLPSALVWITSRPAAANRIPPSCVSRVTEVRGFTDSQKEEYFRRRFSDEDLSSRIISYITASKSLFHMCELPIFCWITAGVLEDVLTTEQRGDLPTTLTDLYSHFLMVQTKRNKKKYQQEHEKNPEELTEADREVLLKLGRLALQHLQTGTIMFYQEELQQCGLEVTEASVFSGVCTEISRRDCGIFQKAVYSFVHRSVQEFLSAVYVIHCSTNRNTEEMENFLRENKHVETNLNSFTKQKFSTKNQLVPSIDGILTEKSLRRETGHLDLFVCFLHGLSVKSNQTLLGRLLGQTSNHSETARKVIHNLKKMRSSKSSQNLPQPDKYPGCCGSGMCLLGGAWRGHGEGLSVGLKGQTLTHMWVKEMDEGTQSEVFQNKSSLKKSRDLKCVSSKIRLQLIL
ncbi:protein NLRC3 isoform X2 [Oryzias melastigma]|uniref:protein NLRC3 isoform X2 n=1 Tax=Oryzias melastigma TaxID=30732 RepID=UPI000CF7C25C|nr:protein NLRC3 isoform X2 [Oryzias melastigma]